MPESQFKKSYDFFKRRLRDPNEDSRKIDPKRILEIIKKRLMVVMINLSETDDPYLIFESLNFKGSPLEQADLVRNYFLMRFPVTDQQCPKLQPALPTHPPQPIGVCPQPFTGTASGRLRSIWVCTCRSSLNRDMSPAIVGFA